METKIKNIEQESRQVSGYISRLGHSPGPASIHQELQATIKEAIHSIAKELDYVRTFVEDEEDNKTRQAQELTIRKLSEDLSNHRALYRKAILKAKNNLENSHATDRNLLFDGRKGTSRRAEYSNNAVLQASSDVTAELRRTHEMMSNELSKSSLSQELLQQSSQTLETLHEEYSAFQSILAGSKRLLKELETADRADRLWIWASLSFFLTVVAWILYRRIISKGVNLMVWIYGGVMSRASTPKAPPIELKEVTPAADITIDEREATLLQNAKVSLPHEDSPFTSDDDPSINDEL